MNQILKKKDIDNFDIMDICNYLGINVKIVMRDQSELCLESGSYIINYDTSQQGGSHWTGAFVQKKMVYFFDSYGFQPPQEFIITWFNNKYKIKYSDTHIQDLYSIACGFFAVCFLIYMNYGTKSDLENYQTFLSQFIQDDYTLDVKNDMKVKEMIKYFLKHHSIYEKDSK